MVEWRLKCDARCCAAELVEQGEHDDLAIRRLLRRAREAGWAVAGDVDHCPAHRSVGS
jgi:uncharacterized membrane protein